MPILAGSVRRLHKLFTSLYAWSASSNLIKFSCLAATWHCLVLFGLLWLIVFDKKQSVWCTWPYFHQESLLPGMLAFQDGVTSWGWILNLKRAPYYTLCGASSVIPLAHSPLVLFDGGHVHDLSASIFSHFLVIILFLHGDYLVFICSDSTSFPVLLEFTSSVLKLG